MKILIANSNETLNNNYKSLFDFYECKLITQNEELNISFLEKWNPDYIFFPHWSNIIPEDIFNNFKCIVFHMTDLPFGRGGSPLQNLILRGYEKTKISAIKVISEIDAGDIYLKRDLSLNGTAYEIYNRASLIIIEMIKHIIKNNPTPIPQNGEVVNFQRRKPSESNFFEINELKSLYNFIRMLDAPGYPYAFIETKHFNLKFQNAELDNDSKILANVIITKKNE